MLKQILEPQIQDFIKTYQSKNIIDLILKGSPFPQIPIQELANQIECRLKCKDKLPTWYKMDNIYYPSKISIEQTSSEITAKYKADLISGNTIIDITGGFGVDAYYFSKKFNNVTHCEINKELSNIVEYNKKILKLENIETYAEDGIEYLKQTSKTFDYIYVDPSRRNDEKGKVFLLKDCLPNLPEHLDFLFSKTDKILIKNSPMLDITQGINELQFVKTIHIIAINNEVKELLFLLEKGYNDKIKIKTINIKKGEKQLFEFYYKDTANVNYQLPLQYLYEPNTAILKSGGFNHLSEQLNIFKLHKHTHLYTSDKLVDFPGRRFKIDRLIVYNKKELKKVFKENKANITTRNFPKHVEQLRKETKLKEGGEHYLFFTRDINDKNIVAICSPLLV